LQALTDLFAIKTMLMNQFYNSVSVNLLFTAIYPGIQPIHCTFIAVFIAVFSDLHLFAHTPQGLSSLVLLTRPLSHDLSAITSSILDICIAKLTR